MRRWFSTRSSVLGLFCTAGLFGMVGCAGSVDGFKGPRGEVTGTVTFRGEPVPEGCLVRFQTLEGNTYSADGVVQADGSFQLKSNGSPQIPAVTYGVMITPPANPDDGMETSTVDPEDLNDPVKRAELERLAKERQKEIEASLPFPRKHMSLGTSTISFPVEPGKNVADLELEE